MSSHVPLFAPFQRSIARPLALAAASAALTFLLSGCEVKRFGELEERVTAVEAKAESAEKRAKAAEALAAQTQPIVQPEPAPQTDLDGNADDQAETPDEGSDVQNGDPPMANNGNVQAGA